MRIGITCTLKDSSWRRTQEPDDLQEEFDSPETVDALMNVFRALGHDVELLGDGRAMLERLLAAPPDFVFNFAEGRGVSRSREAWVPGLLEMLGIPFSGSDPLTLAVTLDKPVAKTLVAAAGVAVPAGIVLSPADAMPRPADLAALRFPVLLKPAWEGSSKGIRHRCLVHRPEELADVVDSLRRDYRQPLLIESFLDGEELTVGVIGNDHPAVIGILRVVPLRPTEHFVYSLEVKRDYLNQVRYESPPQLPAAILEEVNRQALAAYRALGCRDAARVDFRLHQGVPHFLEVNPLPGIHPVTSDLVILARLNGWSYEQLIGRILEQALTRCGLA